MFQKARIKLTLWYLLIIMLISLSFSLVIYILITKELNRGFRRAELRLRAQELNIPLPRRFSFEPEDLPDRLKNLRLRFFTNEDLENAKKRLLFNLILINSGIFIFSGFAGYFLAGKTLSPIEKALEEQKRFIADASHELRTPLTALKTSLEVALRDKKMKVKEARAVLSENLEEVNNLKSLSDKLLSLARYQANGQSLIFQEFDIKEIAENAVKKILPLAKAKKINLEIKVKSQKITGNPESLEEMLLIFLDNGVKYTPSLGTVILSTQTKGRFLELRIKDTGIGIEKKDLPFIFERFYRADSSRSKEKVSGFGLGLSLAKRIIEIHQGEVAVESQVGKGTVFIIKLPLKHS